MLSSFVSCGRVRLGFVAPDGVKIYRKEVLEEIHRQQNKNKKRKEADENGR